MAENAPITHHLRARPSPPRPSYRSRPGRPPARRRESRGLFGPASPLRLRSSGGLAARPAAPGVAPGTRASSTSASGGRSFIRRVASPGTRCRPRRCSGSPTTASARSTWCATGPCSSRSWDGRHDESRRVRPGGRRVRRSPVALLSHLQCAVRSGGRRLRRAILRRLPRAPRGVRGPRGLRSRRGGAGRGLRRTRCGDRPRPRAEPRLRERRAAAPGRLARVPPSRVRGGSGRSGPGCPSRPHRAGPAGSRATAFTHVIRRGGRLYIQYWLYYPDSNTALAGSDRVWERSWLLPRMRRLLAGSSDYPGFHRDDWEGAFVRLDPDGTTWVRASSHGHLQGCKWRACQDRWVRSTGWVRVSRGSHSGHVPYRSEPRWADLSKTGARRYVPKSGPPRRVPLVPGQRSARAEHDGRGPAADAARDAAAPPLPPARPRREAAVAQGGVPGSGERRLVIPGAAVPRANDGIEAWPGSGPTPTTILD